MDSYLFRLSYRILRAPVWTVAVKVGAIFSRRHRLSTSAQKRRKTRRACLGIGALTSLLFLLACGGGGGGGDNGGVTDSSNGPNISEPPAQGLRWNEGTWNQNNWQ